MPARHSQSKTHWFVACNYKKYDNYKIGGRSGFRSAAKMYAALMESRHSNF